MKYLRYLKKWILEEDEKFILCKRAKILSKIRFWVLIKVFTKIGQKMVTKIKTYQMIFCFSSISVQGHWISKKIVSIAYIQGGSYKTFEALMLWIQEIRKTKDDPLV